MKLLLFFMLLSLQSNGQSQKSTIENWTAYMYSLIAPSDTSKFKVKNLHLFDVYIYETGLKIHQTWKSDTIVIDNIGNLKYLKIGDRVYKIESPTLK